MIYCISHLRVWEANDTKQGNNHSSFDVSFGSSELLGTKPKAAHAKKEQVNPGVMQMLHNHLICTV